MPRKRKFVLVPMGSAGDVLPFVWLGEGLLQAGHDVVAVVHAAMHHHFAGTQVRTTTYGSPEEIEVLLRHPDLWHPRRGFGLIVRSSEPMHRHILTAIRHEASGEPPTLVAAGLAFAARIASEAMKLPLVTIHLQPMAFMSVIAPPVLRAKWEWFVKTPLWFRRLVYRAAFWQSDWLLAETLNTLRAELGLHTPVRRVLEHYWLSPRCIIGLFPDWFAPRAHDWPGHATTTRFPLTDVPDGRPSPELETFLREGAAPVLFTPGSANAQARHFFEVALEATRQMGCRALFVTPFKEQVPSDFPLSVRPFREVSFARVFPRCRAVVHHGGIGTTAQGLAAGVPQLIMPMSHDQPDNARRIRELGVGESLYPSQFTRDAVVERLRHLTSSKDVGRACREYRDRARNQMPREVVIELIQDIA
jgi:UDP:flavonoid glycosyltransferase YjiC (YdhE family)